MQTKLIWSKGLFSRTYDILEYGKQVGYLKDKSFNRTSFGEYKGKEYLFLTKGILSQCTEIVDYKLDQVIGEITYGSWMSKAIITVNNRTINWKYDNFWQNRWSLYDSNGIISEYYGSTTKGEIDSSIDDALLILSGLFVTNYFKQMTIAVLVAIFIPLWITLID